ncbi:MAG TPA: SEC-C metal-binding domain-containing protein [Thermoanaerobaculia bacterium]|nr:SEC-C metal-binding domain-containing protein [Thermoanaerobaculia bacterium]
MAIKKGRSLNKVVWPSAGSGPATRNVPKIGRNEACPCGSGKKYKDCHQQAGEAFLHKLAREKQKEELRALRADLKERGVPWYKRMFYRA